MKKQDFYIGIDVGGTTCKIGIIDENNEIVFKKSFPSNSKVFAEKFLTEISQLVDDALNNFLTVKSIGMGVPGIIDDGILKIAPNFPNLNNVDFGSFFREKYSLPFTVDNDANAAAIAELVAGNGINYKNFIYITLGTGVGGAIIIDKKIFKGTNGGAGELGHFIIDLNHFSPDLPKFRNGTLEEFVGRKAIINNYNNLKNHEVNFPKENLRVINKQSLDVFDISEAAGFGDEAAIKCLLQVGFYMGISVASFANIFDIPNFIIGGGVSQSDLILEQTEKIAKERALPTVAKYLKIERAKYLNETGIIGAALMGKKNI